MISWFQANADGVTYLLLFLLACGTVLSVGAWWAERKERSREYDGRDGAGYQPRITPGRRGFPPSDE